MPKPLLVAHALTHLQGTLARGFTTVRDPGGGDIGLSMVIERKLIRGPRFYYGGKGLPRPAATATRARRTTKSPAAAPTQV